jgi:hypothetical protein
MVVMLVACQEKRPAASPAARGLSESAYATDQRASRRIGYDANGNPTGSEPLDVD